MSAPQRTGQRVPILYLAPWVDFGGTDKGTIDWFRWIDRDRFAPSLITTQPSQNRRLNQIYPYAEEVWTLPAHMTGIEFARFVFDFIHSRGIRVIHLMNSRLGYDLLPDLIALDRPPAVVVQLHVEEPDRGGFVRYVTTRYGNLVDAFSVVSSQLVTAVEGYDIPLERIHMIPLGVDGVREFNPDRVTPVELHRGAGEVTIICPGRLTAQKDPLLMLEVVRLVVGRHPQVRVNVIGHGELEETVRTRVSELGLDRHVRLHPPSQEFPRWLRGSDILLMTSAFEGIPCVIYEALAMRVPVVAPALDGNKQLMADTGGLLVEPRDDIDAYASAVSRLVDDRSLAAELGSRGRERMLELFSTRRMAAQHEQLYERLIAAQKPATREPEVWGKPPPLRLSSRPAGGTPMVTVVTPCFNHGRYLKSMLNSVFEQDYPSMEVIVVDDASTDANTISVIAELEEDGRVTVLRQPRNSGPSAARNVGIAEAQGRYILPVDADNILLPGSVRHLVEQLQRSGERVGYIYPSYTYFGNREYTYEPPEYNLYSLLHMNFADTCSLIDRELFDAGLRYPEDIELGHEDWDFALTLATHDIIGRPSGRPVLRYRKHGFTRSDAVEYLRFPFREEIRSRHPELFGRISDVSAYGRFRGPGLDIKRRWNPGLSVLAVEPLDFVQELGIAVLDGLQRQTCADFELIAECIQVPAYIDAVVRRIPPGVSSSAVDKVQTGIAMARGRWLMLTHAPAELLADPTTVEKLLRELWGDPELDAIALVSPPVSGGYPFEPMRFVAANLTAHSLVWRREISDRVPEKAAIDPVAPVESLAKAIHENGANLRWRFYGVPSASYGRSSERAMVRLRRDAPIQRPAAKEYQERMKQLPALPALPDGVVKRWAHGWTPPETVPLLRFVSPDGQHRVISNEWDEPSGYTLELIIGSIQRFSPPGTARLISRGGRYMMVPRGSEQRPDDDFLGYLEEVALPLLLPVERVILDNGTETLALGGGRDHVGLSARERTWLGFIEPFPNEPAQPIPYSTLGLPVLVRWLDMERRCHRYDAVSPENSLADGLALSAELGQLGNSARPDTIPVFLDGDGRLSTDRYSPEQPAPTIARVAKWAAAPVSWRGFGQKAAKARSVARRTVDGSRLVISQSLRRTGVRPAQRRLVGYLYQEPGPRRRELFSAVHPVVGDQFITHHPVEARDLGYEHVTSIGYITAAAPLTGQLGGRRAAPVWASRFGQMARTGG